MKKTAYLVDVSSWLHITWSQAMAVVGQFGSASGALGMARNRLNVRAQSLVSEIDQNAHNLAAVKVYAALDVGKTWRHRLLPSYKAQRPNKSDVQRQYFAEGVDILKSHGFECVASPDNEADDVIATLVSQHPDWTCRILSSDHDLWQLAAPNVELLFFENRKNVLLTGTQIEERLTFPATRLPTYKALVGDSSDNIKGVTGIGEAAALPLVRQYEDIVDIYDNISKLVPSVRKRLAGQLTRAEMLQDICTLRRDVTLERR
jgi:DNA polymerase I